MKPSTLLTKKIVSGLVASLVLVGLVACDNAGKREVRAKLNDKAKVQKQDSIDRETKCTPELLELIADRDKTVRDTVLLLQKSEDSALSETEKTQLTNLIEDLKTKSDAFISKVRETKSPSGKAITGCYKENATAPAQRKVYNIRGVADENLRLANAVKEITKKSNSILDAASQDAEQTQQSTLLQEQKYKIKTELADALSEANKDGRMYILNGQVQTGSDAAASLREIQQQKRQSVCHLEATSGKLTADTLMSVVSVTVSVDLPNRISKAHVIFQGEENHMFVLNCQLSATEEVNQSIRAVLGSLIELVQAETPQTPNEAEPETIEEN